MNDYSVFNSAESILDVNATLIQWLGVGYWLSLFAVGVAIWCIRYLKTHLFAPLESKPALKNRALLNVIMGGVMCAMVVVPVGQVPYLNQMIDVEDGQLVTPAAAFTKVVLADGSDYLTLVILISALGLPHDLAHNSEYHEVTANEHAESWFGARTDWLQTLITYEVTGYEDAEALAFRAGQTIEETEDDEGGIVRGVKNAVGAAKVAYDAAQSAFTIFLAMLASPYTAITYIVGLFILAVVALWINLIAYAFPLLFAAVLFLLPIAYLFDGYGRLMPLIKFLVAFALAKPLAMLFVALPFSIIDGYLLNLYHTSGIAGPPLDSVFTASYWEVVTTTHANMDYSLPLILGLGSAGALMALIAPMVAFLILGAEGGTLAGFVSSMYLTAANAAAKVAGRAAPLVGGPMSAATSATQAAGAAASTMPINSPGSLTPATQPTSSKPT
ncbi:hypothetical protein SCOR_02355 [Sulfidibacter corallicola]|uniref:Uncharacterized protein n=1 Tax=Sulfidibacter corallicola TaxID=2818388 RepID=A0A8A4THF2_SULCO|nr:hypothetical protein [Sulfidibacter corallicola]QTD48634.1 hypothetical protein J3U87_23890 [Sulfidibacter corallicola]